MQLEAPPNLSKRRPCPQPLEIHRNPGETDRWWLLVYPLGDARGEGLARVLRGDVVRCPMSDVRCPVSKVWR